MERRHTLGGAALFDHRTNLVSAFIIQGKWRANQVRTAIASLRRGAVAKTTVPNEDLLPTLDGGGIGHGAADQEVTTRTRRSGGRGLCDQPSGAKQVQGQQCF